MEEWREWWETHEESLIPLLSRCDYLRLKLRPLCGAEAILWHRDIPFQQRRFQCFRCGELMRLHVPDLTIQEGITDFEAVESGWIYPLLYCPNGCQKRLWKAGRRPLSWETLNAIQEAQKLALTKKWQREREERSRSLWGDLTCNGCGRKLSTWADNELRRCGYCRYPLGKPPRQSGD